MAIATNHASKSVSYEELFSDILVTKSLVFSVVGLDAYGLAWVHRLTEYGFATIGIRYGGTGEIQEGHRGHGILRLGDNLEDIRGSDVIILCGDDAATTSRLHALLPHLRRGQLLCCMATRSALDPTGERWMIEETARWGLTVGEDFFLAYLPKEALRQPGMRVDVVVTGATEACARIGNAVYLRILSLLVCR